MNGLNKIFLVCGVVAAISSWQARGETVSAVQRGRSIREFGVLPENAAAENTKNLQKAIDWAAVRGAALFVERALSGGRGNYPPAQRLACGGAWPRGQGNAAPGQTPAGRAVFSPSKTKPTPS